MKITALVENTCYTDLAATHGLCLYIEHNDRKILFDLGPDQTAFDNASALGIDLSEADTVIISHGHYDHGGGLGELLKLNGKARVFIQEKAFDNHFSQSDTGKRFIGIDKGLKDHPQISFVKGDFVIDESLSLITAKALKLYSSANDNLFDDTGRDSFEHEQSLVINGRKKVLIMGCGHCGVVNILEKAGKTDVCIGGFHLYSPRTGITVDKTVLLGTADELKKRPETVFYTCHCTGTEAFKFISQRTENLKYLSCGDSVEIE